MNIQDTIMRYTLYVVALTLSFLFMSLSIYFIKKIDILSYESQPQATIVVSGKSKINAVPDVVTFTFTIKEEASTAKAAQQALAEKSSNIINTLKNEYKIPEEDIKTQSYNVYPKYKWEGCENAHLKRCIPKRIKDGYVATQVVKVKIRNDNDIAKILTMLSDYGAENVNGPVFTVDNKDELIERARMLAIEDAKKKAEKLANKLGVKLGRILNYSENEYSQPFPIYKARTLNYKTSANEAELNLPEIPKGENEISFSVSIEYEIK